MSASERFVLADGRQLRRVLADTWELLTIGGEHISYLKAETLELTSTRPYRA